MAYPTYKITSMKQIIDIAKGLPKYWFRGQDKDYGNLTPSVFRRTCLGIDIPRDPEVEFALVEEFKRHAPALTRELPSRKDHLSWLFLMQHHRTPTRLLDWTESILVALYFAVCDNYDTDGEIWAMDPHELNLRHELLGILYGVATIDNTIVKYLAEEPMYINKETAQEKLHKKYSLDPPRYPVSVQYPRTTGRMVSQLSTFTIHPRPCKDCAITEIMREEIYLIKYIIPKEKKKSFLRDLFLLGIRRHTLFQDLDSLSIDLVFKLDLLTEKVKVKIPKCGGLYKKND